MELVISIPAIFPDLAYKFPSVVTPKLLPAVKAQILVPEDPPIDVLEEYPCEINTELLSPISVVHLCNPFESISNPEICPIVAVNSPVEVTSNVVAPPF